MSSSERRRAEVEYVRGLPNFDEIVVANAPGLHIEGDVVTRFAKENIVLTPMNMNPPISYMMLSRYDYVQEHDSLLNGGASWDDTMYNNAQIGDLFGFVFYQTARGVDRMELFEILDILGPEHRRSRWVIAEHANRRVLRLSKYLGRLSYSAFKAAQGYQPNDNGRFSIVRGTMRTTWPVDVEVEMQGEVEPVDEDK